MSYKTVVFDTRGPVSWVILNRPERLNAFSTELGLEARDALCRALADETTRVVVLTGKGRAFSAGADVTEIGADPDPVKRIDIMATIAHDAIASIRQAGEAGHRGDQSAGSRLRNGPGPGLRHPGGNRNAPASLCLLPPRIKWLPGEESTPCPQPITKSFLLNVE